MTPLQVRDYGKQTTLAYQEGRFLWLREGLRLGLREPV